jgi:hypothetical protein
MKELIDAASQKYGLPPELIAQIIKTESNGNPKAQSPVGAQGLMQLMPAMQKHYGVTDPFDPAQNIEAGSRYMADLLKQYKGNTAAAVAHYNGGTSQGKLVMSGKEPTKDETFKYVRKVMAFGQGMPPPPAQNSTPMPATFDRKKIGMGIANALANGVSEDDVIKHLASMPEMSGRVQGAFQAGATPTQILEAAGGDYYKNFVKDKQANDPSAGMSGVQKFAAGAGGRMMDYWQGIKQIAGQGTPEEMDEKRRLDAPLMQHGAAKAGSFATDAALSLAAPAGAATTVGRVALGAAGGGGLGALEGVGTGESRGQNAAMGAAAGAAGGAIAKPLERAVEWLPAKVANLARNKWTDPAEKELHDKAAAMGVSLRPSQQGSKIAGVLEKAQRYTPIAGAILERAEKEQADELSGAVSRMVAKNASPRIQQEGAERVVLDSVSAAAEKAKADVAKSFDLVADAARTTGTTSVGMDGLRQASLKVQSDLQDVFQKFGLTKLRGRVTDLVEGTTATPGSMVNAQGQVLNFKTKPKLTFDEARALREDIGSAIKAAEKASFTGGATEKEVGALKTIFRGLEQDLDKWGNKNQLVKGMWDQAREKYKTEYFETFKQPGNVRKMLRPDFDPDRVVTSSLLPEHGAKAAALIKTLDPEGKAAAKQLLVQRALDGFSQDPAKAVRRLDFGKAGRSVFTPDELKELDALREVIKRVALDQTPGKNTGASTSRMARQLGGGVASATLLGGMLADDQRWAGLAGAPLGIAGAAALANTKTGRRLLMTQGKAALGPKTRRATGLASQAAGQGIAQAIRKQVEEENAP